MPSEWRESILIPIFKNIGDIQNLEIKITSHTLKIWERVIEKRLRRRLQVSDQQFRFMSGRSITDAIFALRQLIEKHREGQKELHSVFIDLEKAYDRIPRQEGAALNPFLFLIIMDCMTREIQRVAPWDMLFADDVVVNAETREEAEERLEWWQAAMEDRDREKTEYLRVAANEEQRRVQEMGKGRMYMTTMRPTMMYLREAVAVTKKQEENMQVAETKMLSWSLGLTLKTGLGTKGEVLQKTSTGNSNLQGTKWLKSSPKAMSSGDITYLQQ
ncbi:uncharacterized protein LOC122254548 [Penaeus japonicus]|uniref:uncharacterized protein LOC122254548 n=1 Tax=Penaeus japonicus TaxID=27405 RepID=UPI001C717A31|nr:uncharacterized protein LOC122254548 [Penaeus japonicus]